MPFLSPNQQCQSIEGKNSWPRFKYIHSNNVTLWLLMIMMSTVQQRQHGDTRATGCESWSRKHCSVRNWLHKTSTIWTAAAAPYYLTTTNYLTTTTTTSLLHPFNGLFSRTTWVSRHSGFYWSKRWWGGSGSKWTICKSFAPHSRQITIPVPHHCFYRPDALPATQPTASNHWRQINHMKLQINAENSIP